MGYQFTPDEMRGLQALHDFLGLATKNSLVAEIRFENNPTNTRLLYSRYMDEQRKEVDQVIIGLPKNGENTN
jgi:hypothetical protein